MNFHNLILGSLTVWARNNTKLQIIDFRDIILGSLTFWTRRFQRQRKTVHQVDLNEGISTKFIFWYSPKLILNRQPAFRSQSAIVGNRQSAFWKPIGNRRKPAIGGNPRHMASGGNRQACRLAHLCNQQSQGMLMMTSIFPLQIGILSCFPFKWDCRQES